MVTEEALAVARKPLPSTVVFFQLESFQDLGASKSVTLLAPVALKVG